MKKFLCLSLVLAMLTACGQGAAPKTVEWSDEMIALMETVNAEHQQVEKVDVDYSPYFVTPAENMEDSDMMGKDFTKANIMKDLDYLFELLKKEYGLYDYYGGDEVFLPAKEAIYAECQETNYMTEEAFRDILKKHLPMVTDMHLRLNYHTLETNVIYPYYHTDMIFSKTEEGFVNPEGKIVASVEGYDSPEEVIRRSLTREGDLVYYLILLDLVTSNEDTEREAVVHYTDGSSETLVCEVKRSAYFTQQDYNSHEEYDKEGIPVMYTKHMESTRSLKAAEKFANEPVSILNLTCSSMGNILDGKTWTTVYDWMKSYAGTEVPSNMKAVFRRNGGNLESLPGYSVAGNEAIVFGQEDAFIENDEMLIILTSKLTDGDAEILVDMAHNLENTLIIGNNTQGSCISSWDVETKLPNTGILVQLGGNLNLWPEGHFEELYGLMPDIWCPEAIAEEAAVNFVMKNLK